MKKLLIATNVLTLIVLYMSSFTSTNNVKPRSADPVPCSTCIDLSNPINGIAATTAEGMAKIYRTNQWKILNANQSFSDSRSVWFSLDKLKSFIGEIENTMCAGKDQCHINDFKLGVRIYEAAYPNFTNMGAVKANTDYSDVKDAYTKHMTLFMVPTYHDNDLEVDFDPRHLGSNVCKPTPLKDIIAKSKYLDMSPKSASAEKKILSAGIRTEDPVLVQRSASPASTTLLSKNTSLILSANEAQTFYSEKKGNTKLMKMGPGDGIMNHGNTIPPDVDNGTAF